VQSTINHYTSRILEQRREIMKMSTLVATIICTFTSISNIQIGNTSGFKSGSVIAQADIEAPAPQGNGAAGNGGGMGMAGAMGMGGGMGRRGGMGMGQNMGQGTANGTGAGMGGGMGGGMSSDSANTITPETESSFSAGNSSG
jgi:hypothetical protein